MRESFSPKRLFVIPLLLLAALGVSSLLRAATLTVTNVNDSGAGSLRQAISDAGTGDTINFSVIGTITLTNSELLITNDLTITGLGATNLAISGNHASRLFEIGSNATVTIAGLTLRDGEAPNGANSATDPSGPGVEGGGIFNAGTLIVSACGLIGNSAGIGGNGYPGGAGATEAAFTMAEL